MSCPLRSGQATRALLLCGLQRDVFHRLAFSKPVAELVDGQQICGNGHKSRFEGNCDWIGVPLACPKNPGVTLETSGKASEPEDGSLKGPRVVPKTITRKPELPKCECIPTERFSNGTLRLCHDFLCHVFSTSRLLQKSIRQNSLIENACFVIASTCIYPWDRYAIRGKFDFLSHG